MTPSRRILFGKSWAWIRAGALLLEVIRSFAAEPLFVAPDLLRTKFTDQEGLASNIINALVQTRNGMLWIATPSGLDRFDGHRFFRMGSETRDLREGPDGDLWVATTNGLVRLDSASLHAYQPVRKATYHFGNDSADVANLVDVEPDGSVLATTRRGLFQLKGDQLQLVQELSDISRIEPADHGHYLLIGGRRFVEWDGKRLIEHPEIARLLGVPADQIFHVLEERTGVRWYATIKGLARVEDGKVRWCRGPDKKIVPRFFRIYRDRGGRLWACTDGFVYRVVGETLQTAFGEEANRSILVDRDGTLWLGTNGHGLERFRERIVQNFSAADGLPPALVTTVLRARDGRLWAGSNCGGLSWFDGRRFHNLPNTRSSCVYTLAEDDGGDLWVGTETGLFRLHQGIYTGYSSRDGFTLSRIFSVAVSADGSVWVSGPDGVNRLVGRKFQALGPESGLLPRAMFPWVDHNGTLWAGTTSGLDYFSGDRFVPIANGPEDLVPLGEDSYNRLYASTASTMYRLAGHAVSAMVLPHAAWAMLSVPPNLWLSGKGIRRISQNTPDMRERHTDEPVDGLELGIADGLTPASGSGASRGIAQTADGKLWFAGFQELAMIDPAALHPAPPVRVYMQEVIVDRQTRDSARELHLPPGPHHVEIHFDTIEINSPERTHLQYRLDGADPSWFDAAPAHAVIYTDIPPGRHHFHVRACNRDGVWDRAGIVYDIVEEPYFYQTRTFQLAGLGAIVIALFGIHRLRVYQIAGQMNARLEERLGERERIARELHDTLLQGFQGLMLHFQSVLKQIPEREPARESMSRALGLADQVLVEGRERVRDLRADEFKNSELANSLGTFGEELVQGSTTHFKLTIVKEPRALHPVVCDEVYRIAREALANAFRHSQARNIEVDLTYAQHQLSVRVRDDGCGMDERTATEGRRDHWGISGMRERARQIGGTLTIWSKRGSGTEVDVSVPGRIAYVHVARQSSWRRMLGGLWPAKELQ